MATPTRPRFFLAQRDTRWDPYPGKQPTVGVAHDFEGFWGYDAKVGWYKTPTSYVLLQQVTEAEAIAARGE